MNFKNKFFFIFFISILPTYSFEHFKHMINQDYEEFCKEKPVEKSFLDAIDRNEVKSVLELLNKIKDINFVDWNGNTSLMRAAEFCHLEIIKILLAQAEINVNIKEKSNKNALIIAAVSVIAEDDENKKNVLKALLQAGTNINESSFMEYTFLDLLTKDIKDEFCGGVLNQAFNEYLNEKKPKVKTEEIYNPNDDKIDQS